MNKKDEKLYLIDGTALIYRSYYAFINNPLRDSSGKNTSAVFGVIKTILKLITTNKPDKIIISFDLKEPTFRHQLTDTYKANRPPAPDELIEQIDPIKEIFKLLGIPEICYEGYEADDVLATLAQSNKKTYDIVIVTGDKDFNQIIDKDVTLYDPFAEKYINEKDVLEKYGVTPEQFLDYLSIIGDSADNVPGIKGIGAKGAASLLQEYSTLPSIYENIDKISSLSLKNKLIIGEESARLSKQLIKLITEVPLGSKYDLEEVVESSKFNIGDINNLLPFLKKFELHSIGKQLSNQFPQILKDKSDQKTSDKPQPDSEQQTISLSEDHQQEEINAQITKTMLSQQSFDFYTEPNNYETIIIDNSEAIRKFLEEFASAATVSYDLQVMDDINGKKSLMGVSLCFGGEKVYFIPLHNKKLINMWGDYRLNSEDSDNLFSNISFFTCHNMKPDYHTLTIKLLEDLFNNQSQSTGSSFLKHLLLLLCLHNIKDSELYSNSTQIRYFDTMLASYLLDANNLRFNLEACILREFRHQIKTKKDLQIPDKIDTIETDIEHLSKLTEQYSSQSAYFTYLLFDKLLPQLRERKQEDLFFKIEMPLLYVLAKMERQGVFIDKNILSDINKVISDEIEKLTKNIYEQAGTEFNINSPQQLSKVLFEDLGITPLKKTKTGLSTDNAVLEKLAESYPVASLLIDYRQLTKLRSTYIEALPSLIDPQTGRVHSSFNQTVTTTGRLSSSNPNLQNIPIRSEAGKQIRKAFLSKEKLILSADYSQIELRILGIMSKDRNLIAAFNNKQDIHSQTAGLILAKPITLITPDERRMAKTINFGIIYGMGAVKLSKEINVSQKEAKEFIEEYFKKFPKIKEFVQGQIGKAKKQGYAETLMGRRLYLPNIHSTNSKLLSETERIAVNMPIQGTAADIIKMAMIKIDYELQKLNNKFFPPQENNVKSEYDDLFTAKMIIQVHDELVFEVTEKYLAMVKDIIVREMKNALPEKYRIIIPLDVDLGTGKNWYEAHS